MWFWVCVDSIAFIWQQQRIPQNWKETWQFWHLETDIGHCLSNSSTVTTQLSDTSLQFISPARGKSAPPKIRLKAEHHGFYDLAPWPSFPCPDVRLWTSAHESPYHNSSLWRVHPQYPHSWVSQMRLRCQELPCCLSSGVSHLSRVCVLHLPVLCAASTAPAPWGRGSSVPPVWQWNWRCSCISCTGEEAHPQRSTEVICVWRTTQPLPWETAAQQEVNCAGGEYKI